MHLWVRLLRKPVQPNDKPTKKYVWKDEAAQDEKTLPLAVRIELEFSVEGNTESYVRTISVPVGGYEIPHA